MVVHQLTAITTCSCRGSWAEWSRRGCSPSPGTAWRPESCRPCCTFAGEPRAQLVRRRSQLARLGLVYCPGRRRTASIDTPELINSVAWARVASRTMARAFTAARSSLSQAAPERGRAGPSLPSRPALEAAELPVSRAVVAGALKKRAVAMPDRAMTPPKTAAAASAMVGDQSRGRHRGSAHNGTATDALRRDGTAGASPCAPRAGRTASAPRRRNAGTPARTHPACRGAGPARSPAGTIRVRPALRRVPCQLVPQFARPSCPSPSAVRAG
jgi:hypothetical protein